jgi:ATP-dependent DNA helicase RecG
MSDGPLTYADLARFPLTAISALHASPKKVDALERIGVGDILDLVTYYPRRHVDRSRQVAIRDLRPGEEAMVVGTVRNHKAHRPPRRGRGRPLNRDELDVTDDTGGRLKITFFNTWGIDQKLPVGTEAVFFGKVDTFNGRAQMTNPVVDVIGGEQTGRIISIYPQHQVSVAGSKAKTKLESDDFARWISVALGKTRARGLAEPLPAAVRDRLGLVDRERALWGYHQPEAWTDIATARKRLVFDELLRVQLALVLRKRALERTAKGMVHGGSGELVRRFHEALPYPLTGAQERVIDEIVRDLTGPHPMHRLLQGDVGAGKTVVAVTALLVAVQGGHQGALMAPTEVLAEQHFAGISALLRDLTVPGDPDADSLFAGMAQDRPLRVELLTNKVPAAARRKLHDALEAGEVDLLIGTHALIEDKVAFRSLGVVVIDEQHRFGVEQRDALRQKGADGLTPDVLVMTATPIPRTAAMTVYGDLDVSVLDELPPGRTPIRTEWVPTSGEGDDPEAEAPVWDHVRAEVAAGRQAYVVCPLVEGSDKLEVASAEETLERLSGGELHGLSLGLLHGRMASADKERVMEAFRSGRTQVLVATTVIEVGVDVPNATVMVILDADRFGIAQLHQMRGRVGRGAHASTCWLVGAGTTTDGEARLEAMVRTTDGFELAEVDLDLRGEGTLMGERQKGKNDLKLASLRRDREWVEKAREVAFELVDADPDLSHSSVIAEEVRLFLGEDDADYLLKS